MKLFLDREKLIRPGSRVMHLAPERGLTAALLTAGVEYEAFDLDPARYRHCKVGYLDLSDCSAIPDSRYDLILHQHVLEHVPSSLAVILFHLHRALKPYGKHLFSVPVYPGRYAEDFGDLPLSHRIQRFGQGDHVRRFGRDDFNRTLGSLIRIPDPYRLTDFFAESVLAAANIPAGSWSGYTSDSVFCLRKKDWLLSCNPAWLAVPLAMFGSMRLPPLV